ncbi:MAG TPA: DUF1761 domain-containing protein [Candidatus Krumholzibacteria bacterium]|nr:DUF1761 domain-containing protein [Candidatus Krumholzibacteria bacterium]
MAQGGTVELNYLAVMAAALSGLVVGAIWYGPLFGRQWLLASQAESGRPRFAFPGVYSVALLLSMIAAIIMAMIIHAFHATNAAQGALVGFLMWLGLIATVRLTEALFNRTSLRMVLIDAGYRLVWTVVMGMILAVWR